MTREESIKFLALVKVAYPTAFKDMDKESKHATVNMWHSTFPNIPFVIMELALEHFRRVSKFPPTVAEMFEELKSLYHRATFDTIIATQDGDLALAQRCEWIAKYTSAFRGEVLDTKVNYGLISNEELALLPEGGKQQ